VRCATYTYALDVAHTVLSQLQLTLEEPAGNDMMGKRNSVVVVAMRFCIRQRDGKHVHVVHGREVREKMLGQMDQHYHKNLIIII